MKQEIKAIELPSGRWTEVELQMNARLLTNKDLELLRKHWKPLAKVARARFPRALLEGLKAELCRLYLERRRDKTGMPPERFQATEATERAFRDAAAWCFDEGYSLERLILCAEDLVRRYRFPTPQHLCSDWVRQALPLWKSFEERNREPLRPIEQISDFIPAFVDDRIRGIQINCPGLYEQQQNENENTKQKTTNFRK
jgi:hypothetical protein